MNKRVLMNGMGIVGGCLALSLMTSCNMLPLSGNQSNPPAQPADQTDNPKAPGLPLGMSVIPKPAATPDAKAAKAHLDQATAYGKQGQWDLALKEANLSVSLDPNNAYGYSSLGWIYAEKKKWAECIEVSQKAVSLDPKNAYAYSNLGWAYAETAQWDQSIEASMHTLTLDPKNAYAHSNLGWAYAAKGQKDMAAQEYQKSIALDPKNDAAIFALGTLQCKSGQTAAAKEQYNALAKLGSPHATELLGSMSKGCIPSAASLN